MKSVGAPTWETRVGAFLSLLHANSIIIPIFPCHLRKINSPIHPQVWFSNQKDPMKDHEKFRDVKDKYDKYFSEKPGK